MRIALWLFDQAVPFGGPLRSAMAACGRWVGRNPLLAALIASLCLSGFLWWRNGQLSDHLADIKAAQKAAARDQAAVNHEPARVSGDVARQSNVDAQGYYDAGRRAGAAYADAHRVRPPACPSRGTHLSGADRAAPVDDGPGDAAGMVALSQADYDTLTGNSLRLAKVQQDAETLIAAGVAVPSDGP